MLGIVFTELMEMVESRFSTDLLDEIIDRAELPNGGAYTAVGDYSHEEIVRLVTELSASTQVSVPDLLQAFGEYLFPRLAQGNATLLRTSSNMFALLERLDDHIHPEVLKLYPNAHLPRFSVLESAPDRLVLRYDSPRRMESLAVGLIHGAARHFNEPCQVSCSEVGTGPDAYVRLVVQRHAPD